MIKTILARIIQGHRTMKYPAGTPPPMPDRFRGYPYLHDVSRCPKACDDCIKICPTGAIEKNGTIDLGKCLFCRDCEDACIKSNITCSRDYRLATGKREDLILKAGQTSLQIASTLDKKRRKLFGHSLKLRQVSAGGCNACESDINVLNTMGWDLARFGIQFVASPRHADGIVITGPVTKNMELALVKTYDAIPGPKLVIVIGSCAISGGPFIDHAEACNGASKFFPVDLFIPGCPPHPLTILHGLLRLLGKTRY